MTAVLLLVVIGPLGAAVILVAAGSTDRWRRAVALLGLAVGGGTAVALLTEVLPGNLLRARGFEADPWRVGLALIAVVIGIAGVAAEPRSEGARSLASSAALLAGVAAAAVAALATDTAVLAGALVAGTLAVGVCVVAVGAGARAFLALAAADVLVLAGLLLAAGDGMRVPLRLEGAAAALVWVGAAVRVGALPVVPSITRASEERSALAALMAGPTRIGGLVLVTLVAPSSAVAVTAAVAAAWSGRLAARDASAAWAASSVAAMALAGFGLGGSAAIAAAVLLVAGIALGSVIALLGAERVASPALAVAPLGAMLPGAAILATTALARAVSSRADLVVALALALAMGWLSIAGVAGMRRGAARAHPAWLFVPAVAVLAVSTVPGRALDAVAGPAAAALGAGRPLAGIPGALPDELGIALAVAAAASLLAVVPPRRGMPPAGVAQAWSDDVVPQVAASVRMAAVLSVIGVVLVGLLIGVGVTRGFL